MSKMIKLFEKAAQERKAGALANRTFWSSSQASFQWVVVVSLIIMGLALLIVSGSLVYTVREQTRQRTALEAILQNLDKKLLAQSWQIDDVGSQIRSLHSELSNNAVLLEQWKEEAARLKQESEAQKAAVEKLRSEKDALCNQLQVLKTQVTAPVPPQPPVQ